ncbi:MAG: MBL fold metallo-hydrolase [Firmicutes bacterium]|nr:MBL fold metallo-hydrolase [Bacillota bacterium]
MAKKNVRFSKALTIFLSILSLIIGFCAGVVGNYVYDRKTNNIYKSDYVYGDLEMHFLELGNGHTGDSCYIKCGDVDILVDAGSRTSSSTTIANYLDTQVTDKKLEYIIVTHADRDHIAGFAGDSKNPSIFARYEVDIIIDFPLTNKVVSKETGVLLKDYYSERDSRVEKGAKHYNALQCYNNTDGGQRTYKLSDTITLNILYNYYYENSSPDENNYSVCFQIEDGDNKYLFTGDLELEGEEKLVANNSLDKVKLFKAGHHGSKTSSNDCLLDVIQPEVCVVTCCAGSVEYTQNLENTFPTQLFINRISKWTDKVYVTTVGTIAKDDSGKWKDVSYTSLNGIVVVKVNNGLLNVECSNNNTVLKDTDWFKNNRTTPDAWKSVA